MRWVESAAGWSGAAGGGAATTGGGLTPTGVKTANYDASVGDLVLVDVATTGAFTVTLPSADLTPGDAVGIASVATHASRELTVDGDGNDVQKMDDTFGASATFSQVVLVSFTYIYTSQGWLRF